MSSFGRGQFQGVTRDHYLEVDLGDDAPKSGPLYLIAQGSIHDTESSVNVAITQGSRWRAHGMSVEVPDGRGGWVTAQDNLGFPAGRKKTVLFNLTNIFRPGTPRQVRLRTNLEIYWDAIHWAQGAPDAPLKETTLDPSVADLHYRGYSVMHMPVGAGAPEVPDYNQIEGTKQRWRDLIGYYTRYGDMRELLTKIDDRYVIVNSGDEMSLRFPEQPPPPAGWVRDFVIMGDGWIKDGDYNSTFSKTVLPLPYHAKNEYTTRPGTLEDEWVYRQHPEDWQNYHTRYVTPQVFQNALRSELSTMNGNRDRKGHCRRSFSSGCCVAPLVIKRLCGAARRRRDQTPTRRRRWRGMDFILQEVSQAAGINFVHQAPDTRSQAESHHAARSLRWARQFPIVDFDRDGWSDIYVINSAIGSKNALYRNMGDGTFKDVAAELGIADVNQPGTGVSTGAVWGDYDNDGYEDLFLIKWGRPELFHNDQAARLHARERTSRIAALGQCQYRHLVRLRWRRAARSVRRRLLRGKHRSLASGDHANHAREF